MESSSLSWMKDELQALEAKSRRRSLVISEPLESGWMLRDGRRMLNLASNDYLGLAARNDRAERSLGANRGASRGAGASRLVTGTGVEVAELEEQFAAYKGTEGCLLFGSGYMANIGVIPAVVGRDDVVFSDRLNHASIVDGIVLSRAELRRYRHRDTNQLEDMLKAASSSKRKLIVTDSIFSMDGTIAPLRELVWLKERYGAMLMVDEAHSGGLYGTTGQGLIHELGLTEQVELQMGTFSKAYGAYGAYVAGSMMVKESLINQARSFIYSTALPPQLIVTIREHWIEVKAASLAREQLQYKAAFVRDSLRDRGVQVGLSECHIIPVIVGSDANAVRMADRLQQLGIAAVAIRPPTVPEGTARIRLTLMSEHAMDDLRWAVEQIAACVAEGEAD
ncbi:8-amino-7-oxononanoate synthase [Paenibacillus sp. YYML68]|uniref:8-amino-7-oxononanoate synthase n=1 Tax=Paenibacillus sp. YYML68 TaxID=2909250 RepID=UPI0024916D79|nr:8-amino-7-oxononanoate synthase [Paenibacillus sp. YYML68]